MFRSKDTNMNQYMPNAYYENTQMQRIIYELEEVNRKLRNLNNRLRRVESFLGLRTDDKYEKEIYFDE